MKIAVLLFFLLFIVSAYSAERKESTFAVKENGRYSKIYTIKVEKDNVLVNGFRLPKREIEKNLTKINFLLETTALDQNCSDNEFVHQVKTETGFKKERGCLSSKRFEQLQTEFIHLKNLTL